ncbi:FUSC family membrane protein [Chryseolinea sp. H1M3-3]|uniref:FUSC family protein n=1 Tax=Chryseolinea sp. H1M3-3 TaxID=3034144 RepID=UPI0023ECEBB5|nr:FUSC family membrane protein [Chryseolinea sp. H1M3-3]
MLSGKDYLKEIQKFTTSQYWNSGVRITTGVMVPMLIMVNKGWLSEGIPFLWGALFVSLTDTPGPIHHRRNGMIAGVILNALTVLITGFLFDNHVLLLLQVLVFSFFFSLLGIYGARAGAVGTLALVVMLLNMSPMRDHENYVLNAMLTAGGGIWYATFSIMLFRLQPYRLAEQALGEQLIQIADYIRARAAFYEAGSDIDAAFTKVMQEQVDVLKNQNQLRELIFKTRQFVSDASPKSRSIMMVFLESLDLFEETMYTYQDYKLLHQHTRHTDLLKKFHTVILELAAELEHIGLSIQLGVPVKRTPDFTNELYELRNALQHHKLNSSGKVVGQSLHALELTTENIESLVNRLCRLVVYTQLQIDINPTLQDEEEEQRNAASQLESKPLHVSLILENFTLRSNNFRYALRLTVAMIIGYTISAFLSVSHTYWVLLTIITILKPVYNVTRRRNIQRVVGTLGGVLAASLILYLVSNETFLLILLISSMLMAYSFLRINYLGFVIFLTIYIIITFHFLNPTEFKNLIGERLVDTAIGSIIAALAARFIFPVWQHENIKSAMQEVLEANRKYFLAAWHQITGQGTDRSAYNTARNDAIVALTNLSDNFQQMLVEPGQGKRSTLIHQFVIASHALTSRISALSPKDLLMMPQDNLPQWSENIPAILQESVANLDSEYTLSPKPAFVAKPSKSSAINLVSIIDSLAQELRTITKKIAVDSV